MFHRPGFARDLAAALFDFLARLVRVFDFDREMAEAGAEIAGDFINRFEDALEKISRHPAIGSPRYGHHLQIVGLRHSPMKRFPYLIFYLEKDTHIELARVLHGSMDIPSWLNEID